MKIIFKDYTYEDKNSSDKRTYNYETDIVMRPYLEQFKYNKQNRAKLEKEGYHIPVLEYEQRYRYNNADRQREREALLRSKWDAAELHDNILQSASSSMNDNDFAALRFSYAFDSNADISNTGVYGKRYSDALSALGNANSWRKSDGTDNEGYATDIKLNFQREKRYLAGHILDGLKRDNQNTSDNFIKELSDNLGLSIAELEANGITHTHDEYGNGSISFSKNLDTPIKRAILKQLRHIDHEGYDAMINIVGVNSNGQEISKRSIGNAEGWLGKGIERFGQLVQTTNIFGTKNVSNKNYSKPYYDILDILDETENIKNKYFEENNYDERLMQGWRGSPIENLGSGKMYKDWAIDRLRHVNGDVAYTKWYATHDWEPGQAITDKDSYTNFDLEEADNIQRSKLYAEIFNADNDNLLISAGALNGKAGVWITKRQITKSDEPSKSNPQQTEYRPLHVFIEGVNIETGGAIEDQYDSNIRAANTANNLQKYRNASHKMSDGSILKFDAANSSYVLADNKGNVIRDFIPVTDARALLNMDYAGSDGVDYLYNKYATNDGHISNSQGLLNDVKKYAAQTVQELYPSIDLLKPDGTAYTIDELLSMRDISTNTVNAAYSNLFNTSELNKLNMFYRIYAQLDNVRTYFN